MTDDATLAVSRQGAERGQCEQEIVVGFLPTIRKIATSLMRRLPPSVRIDDLEAAGVIGLLQALQQRDPERADQFEAYARRRIEGAMLDELRRADLLPKDARQLSRRIVAAMATVRQRDGALCEEAVAHELGVDVPEYRAMLERTTDVRLLSISQGGPGRTGGDHEDDLGELLQLASEGPSALEALLEAESTARVAEALRHLPLKQRQVLALYYLEELNMKQIAVALGLTQARVCQIHAEALHALRCMLEMQEHDQRPPTPRPAPSAPDQRSQ